MKQRYRKGLLKVLSGLMILGVTLVVPAMTSEASAPVAEIKIRYDYDAIPFNEYVSFGVGIYPHSVPKAVIEDGTGSAELMEDTFMLGSATYFMKGTKLGTVTLRAMARDNHGLEVTKQLEVIKAYSISDFTISGKTNEAIEPVTVQAIISDRIETQWYRNMAPGDDFTEFDKTEIITNLPDGLTAVLDGVSNSRKVCTFTISGTPTTALSGVATLTERYNENPNAKFDIVENSDSHQHTKGEWIVDQKATDTTDGSKHKECTICKAVLETASIPKYSYEVVEGKGSVWTVGTDTGMEIVINADYAKFQGLKIDGTVVDPSNYDVREGSTIITLKTGYLKALTVGKHSLVAVFDGKEVGMNFEIAKATQEETNASNVPKTGDMSNAGLWIGLLGVTVLLGSVFVIRRRKNNITM